MTALAPDVRPLDNTLEAALALPEEVPEDLRAMHDELMTRMRNEARTVSMGTIQLLLIDRITYWFTMMKLGERNRETSIREAKDMLDFWLKATTEFNRMLQASESKSRTTVLVEVQNILRHSAKEIAKESPSLAQSVTMYWNEEFARIDL